MSLDSRRLDKVFEEAEMAFWDAVASALPEIKTGDFSPMDSLRLEKAMKEAIQSWYEGNQTIHDLESRVARLERKKKSHRSTPFLT